MKIILFVIGMVVGAFIGLLACALLSANGREE